MSDKNPLERFICCSSAQQELPLDHDYLPRGVRRCIANFFIAASEHRVHNLSYTRREAPPSPWCVKITPSFKNERSERVTVVPSDMDAEDFVQLTPPHTRYQLRATALMGLRCARCDLVWICSLHWLKNPDERSEMDERRSAEDANLLGATFSHHFRGFVERLARDGVV